MAGTGTRFDAMLAQAKKLVAVMEERQFGHFTWHQMISEGMHDLNAIYYDKDFEGNQKEVGKPV